MLSRNSRAAAASASSILESAKPTWMSTHSPGSGMSSASRPTLITRRTPLTSTLARSGWSGRNSITSPGMPRHMRSPFFLDEVEHDLDRFVDGRDDRFGQADAVVHAGWFAANDQYLAHGGTERVEHAEHHVRLHAVAVEEPPRTRWSLRPRRLAVRFDDIDRTGLVTARHGIDQDRGVHVAGQVIGQMHAADAIVSHGHPFRQVALGQPIRDLHAEAVITQEDVADSRDEDALIHVITALMR